MKYSDQINEIRSKIGNDTEIPESLDRVVSFIQNLLQTIADMLEDNGL